MEVSDWRSSRKALGADLQGKQVFDSSRVLDRLGISEVSDNLVTQCRAALFEDRTTSEAILQLKRLVGNADKLTLDELEQKSGEKDEVTQDKRRREKEMYPHLRKIFEFIENFPSTTTTPQTVRYRRQFIHDPKYLTQDAHFWGFPRGAPDFSLIDLNVKSTLWRERAAFAEIKPSSKQGPKPVRTSDDTVLSLVTQCADYARLHMSARPFQLFSVGLLIFGSHFCVGIFDRDGVTFSPIHDIWAYTELFIRVVRRMACDMSPTELGQDPTAVEVPEDSSLPGAARALAGRLLGSDVPAFPSYTVSMGENNPRQWCTVGPPLWTSLSFIGRGTSIWRVVELDHGKLSNSVVVMKSAWRSSKRLAEADIYKSIVGSHPGVAKLSYGDDVHLADKVISVDLLRRCFLEEKETPVLHRLFLNTIGRPIWEYSTEIEVLKGILGAMRGHEFLYKQGILHRDVSAGNVMLPQQPAEPGCEGFLTDLEFARIVADTIYPKTTVTIQVPPVRHPSGIRTESTTRTRTTFEAEKPVLRGAAMTGTAQFMAAEILHAVILQDDRKTQGLPPVTHAATHDIESFCWVLSYSIGRHLQKPNPSTKARHEQLQKWYKSCFSHTDLALIRKSRAMGEPLELDLAALGCMSEALSSLFHLLRVHVIHHITDKEPLTYEFVMGEIEKTVNTLEKRK
ncbi:hypothetical protein SCP_1203190 [Sparassis crispa]|uniref:Protein kinase domain-containing protein n=1 Tax=Sparassis crispa TaxID=139825 RepID=A0A401H131_9APHY|nr:hypothetical protein SCP_1203190 [Sparassis crispa]GBE88090.1 hypothetical protein SCP_1203190 [Sparassis crispa]